MKVGLNQAYIKPTTKKEISKTNTNSAFIKESDALIDAIRNMPKPSRLLDLNA